MTNKKRTTGQAIDALDSPALADDGESVAFAQLHLWSRQFDRLLAGCGIAAFNRQHVHAKTVTNDCPKFCDSSHIIKAIPVNTGQYVQIKYFSGGFSQGSETMNTPVPAKVFFDINLKFTVRLPIVLAKA